MPAGYTHYCFGKDVYKHLDDQNIKDLLLRNENCFLIGLHGPDIFFYERWNKIARKMHQEKANTFFEKAQDIIQNTIAPVFTAEDDGVKIVPTLSDKVKGNTMWCGTFQIVWNDLKNEIVKQDIEFSPQLDCVDNLNKSAFSADMISAEDYYKTYGIISPELKTQIETDLNNKFGKTSDFINNFNWNTDSNAKKYLIYAMLVKDLKFATPFDDLETGDFAGKDTKTSYFGLKANSNSEARSQVSVLYYNNEKDKAISISTTTNDEIILCRTNTIQNFNQIWEKITNERTNYTGNTSLEETELLQVPEISINSEKEYTDLENKEFEDVNGEKLTIEKAMQTIDFELNKEGAKLTSEAGMAVTTNAIEPQDIRDFSFNDSFVIFLKEKDKELPYFALNVSDIEDFQK